MLLQEAASQSTWLDSVHDVTSILVDLIVIVGGLLAAIKFRLFNSLGFRWRSEVTCTHTDLASGRVVFVGEYIVQNTGERPLDLLSVSLAATGGAEVSAESRGQERHV
jgi:hypothetical protein